MKDEGRGRCDVAGSVRSSLFTMTLPIGHWTGWTSHLIQFNLAYSVDLFHVRRRFALALFQRRPSFAVWILLGLCVCEVRRRYNSIIMIRHEPIYFYDVVVIDCSIFHSVESADHFEFFTQSLAPSRFTELAYVLLDNWTIFCGLQEPSFISDVTTFWFSNTAPPSWYFVILVARFFSNQFQSPSTPRPGDP